MKLDPYGASNFVYGVTFTGHLPAHLSVEANLNIFFFWPSNLLYNSKERYKTNRFASTKRKGLP